MFEYDPKTSLQHFPAMPMAKYGINPYAENCYRVVYGGSRRHLVFGTWPDGSQCAHWVRSYPQAKDPAIKNGWFWILEGWRPAIELHSPGRVHWEENLICLGPWPERGDYELIEVFSGAPPTSGLVEKLITWSRAGRERVSLAESMVYQRDAAILEKKQKGDMADALIRDRLPAFGPRAFAGGSVRRRSHDEDRELKSAEELGLPTTPGMRSGKRISRLIKSAA